MPRFVEEFVPLHKYGLCIALYAFSINIGFLIALTDAVILPKDDETELLEQNEVAWRIILGFPLLLFFISMVGFLTAITFDGPSYYMAFNNFEAAE